MLSYCEKYPFVRDNKINTFPSLPPDFELLLEGVQILGLYADDSNFSKLTIRRIPTLVDPEDNVEIKAQELKRQTIAGINPCGSEYWNPRWDDPK